MPGVSAQHRGTRGDPLSAREIEVVARVIEGDSNREIADSLGLSVRTVQSHVVNSRVKLGARSRTHLAVLALRAGVVPLCPPKDQDRAQ